MFLKNRLIRALEKDIKSSAYPLETNNVLFEGKKALQKAKNDEEIFQIAIGIYNWVAGGGWAYGFKEKTSEVETFLSQAFKSEKLKDPEQQNIPWVNYFLNLGAYGVLVSPDKFKEKQQDESGYPCAKTPLAHLQISLKQHDNNVFLHDAFARNSSEQTSIAELKMAVSSAVGNYKSYHQKAAPANDRGLKAGFFSFFRHGEKGLTTAREFGNEFNTMTTVAEGMAIIRDFLAEPSRAFHYHSFASYLADSLAEQGFVALHKKDHYAQSSLVRELNQWINSTNDGVGTLATT